MAAQILGRPLGIWVIVAYLAYGIFGTASNFVSAWLSGTSYGAVQTLFGSVLLIANCWLLCEIWLKTHRQALGAYVNGGILLVLYGIMLIGQVKLGQSGNIVAVLIMGGLMGAIWVAISLYLRRYQAATP